MKSLTLVLVFALCVITTAQDQPSSPAPAGETGTLTGVVTDPLGAVYARAVVRIVHWEITRYGQTFHELPLIYTDSHGRYSVALPSGEYDVLVSAPIFAPTSKRVKVTGGKETKFNAKLKESPFARYIQ